MAATSFHVAGNPTLRPWPSRRPSVTCKAIPGLASVSSSSENQAAYYWSGINADVETHLELSFPAAREPVAVHATLRELVLSAPRTMAPALCVAAADLVAGGDRAAAVGVAAALHAYYAAAHAHERLPGLLEDANPNPNPVNMRLLCGDAVYPFVFGAVAGTLGGSDPVRATRVMVEMAQLMGSQGYVMGQYMHVKRVKEGGGPGGAGGVGAREVCEKKEGALYSCAAACGALLGGADEEETERLRRFGYYVGMIHGMLFGTGRGERVGVESFRTMALKELEAFRWKSRKVERISTLLDVTSEESTRAQ
ncbi:hypothetical protein H6P81_019398 [Aristolochia fimbriata]|uniref:Uncharacterized protein n=1 Tax=Aristolochia fimbriata TaxID=158543 RepID=A0AAV7DW94_ARIFI|nr:hypothetical protein H6P81_019398 [Aristolochia fimbriata]